MSVPGRPSWRDPSAVAVGAGREPNHRIVRRIDVRSRLLAFALVLVMAACSDSGSAASPESQTVPSAAPSTVPAALGDPGALEQCRRTPEKQGDRSPATVAGGYETTQYDVAAWIDTINGPAGPQDVSPYGLDPQDTAPATLCFFDGYFAYSRPPVLDGPSTTLTPRDREAILIKADGTELALLVGPAANVLVQRPNAQ
jgi:hypothetical protein